MSTTALRVTSDRPGVEFVGLVGTPRASSFVSSDRPGPLWRGARRVLSYRPARAFQPSLPVLESPGSDPNHHPTTVSRTSMARSCAICGKVSMGGFNPQSSGMNRVRAHRRYQPNLQPFTIRENGVETKALVCTRCRRTTLKTTK
jgi:ribosomal protein L28